jgi:outer membrane lipoprotein-sorting protein
MIDVSKESERGKRGSAGKRGPTLLLVVTGIVLVMVGVICWFHISKGPGELGNNPDSAKIIENCQATYAALTSYSDTGKTTMEANGIVFPSTFTTRLARPTLYRIEWEQEMPPLPFETRGTTNKGAIWSTGDGDFYFRRNGTEKMSGMLSTLAMASGAGVATIAATFFDAESGDALRAFNSRSSDIVRQKDESVGTNDCYVLKTGPREGNEVTVTRTLWIGKTDHLIHRVKKEVIMNQTVAILPSISSPLREQMQKVNDQMRGKPTIFTETHEQIFLNQPFSKTDFIHQ